MFICPDCAISFGTRLDFVDHVQTHCKNVYTCFCYQDFNQISRFRRHFLRTCTVVGNNNEVVEENIENIPGEQLEEGEQIYNNHNEDGEFSDSDEEYEELEQEVHSLDEIWMKLLLKLLSDSVLSRKKGLDFIKELQSFSSELLSNIVEQTRNFIRPENIEDFIKIIDGYKKQFQVSTEESVQKMLNSNNLYIEPNIDIISNEVLPKTVGGQRVLGRKPENVVNMNLQFALKLFFERKNLLELTLKNIDKLQNDTSGKIRNYIQSIAWLEKKSQLPINRIYLPIFLYNDDFEPDNPLGAHKGKNAQCAFYLSCPVIPKRFRAKLSSLIPAMFVKSSLKKVKPEILFKTLIQNLTELQTTGIEISTDSRTIKIYPVLCGFTGDNLSLNYIGGFTTGFNSTYYCRSCKSHKDEMKQMLEENENTLRNDEQYLRDVEENNTETTGIDFKCPFIEIPHFNVINSMTFDPMHDFAEGICPFTVAMALRKIIQNHDILNLKVLNQRKDLFNYGMYKKSNIPEKITKYHLQKEYLKMSSNEMFTFLYFLPMMLGDLIAENTPEWDYLLLLRRIVFFTFKPSFCLEDIQKLKEMIANHHRMYIALFEKPLKPKMHFLTHYPSAILKFGPLENTDCRRFESKNRDVKQYVRNTFNRKNLSKSIGIKETYKSAYHSYLVYQEHEFRLFRARYVTVESLETTNGIEVVPGEIFLFSFSGIFDDIKFNQDSCFKVGETFVKVRSLFVKHNSCYAIVRKLKVLEFNNQMDCYYIDENDDEDSAFCFNLCEIDNFPQTIHHLNNDKLGLFDPQYMY
uniref:(northern house mosquito) hypothetical protein n=1 Tax=Culex pipiens TaxID=7175 RepID=A0A8D8PFR4_CULPI